MEKYSDELFRGRALAIRALFCTDQATREAFDRPPDTEDIIAELANIALLHKGELSPRKRLRLGFVSSVLGKPTAYLSVTLSSGASPNAYERKLVWGGKAPEKLSGVFIRRMVVHPDYRRRGAGREFIRYALAIAKQTNKYVYCDMKADNNAMRTLASSTGGKENIFWHTPSGTLMVRYIWI